MSTAIIVAFVFAILVIVRKSDSFNLSEIFKKSHVRTKVPVNDEKKYVLRGKKEITGYADAKKKSCRQPVTE